MHHPTEETRKKVKKFSIAGLTHEEIASYLRIDDKTLRNHYRAELDDAMADAKAILGENLFHDACNGDKDARKFWLLTKGKWYLHKPKEDTGTDKTNSLLEQIIDKL